MPGSPFGNVRGTWASSARTPYQQPADAVNGAQKQPRTGYVPQPSWMKPVANGTFDWQSINNGVGVSSGEGNQLPDFSGGSGGQPQNGGGNTVPAAGGPTYDHPGGGPVIPAGTGQSLGGAVQGGGQSYDHPGGGPVVPSGVSQSYDPWGNQGSSVTQQTIPGGFTPHGLMSRPFPKNGPISPGGGPSMGMNTISPAPGPPGGILPPGGSLPYFGPSDNGQQPISDLWVDQNGQTQGGPKPNLPFQMWNGVPIPNSPQGLPPRGPQIRTYR